MATMADLNVLFEATLSKDLRKHPRHNATLKATVDQFVLETPLNPYVIALFGIDRDDSIPCTLISISVGGCAIRTTRRLSVGASCLVHIALTNVRARARILWGRDDFRVDTLYRYGLQFESPLG